MASSEKNLSVFNTPIQKSVSDFHFGIVVSEWNEQITESMYEGSVQTIVSMGGDRDKIHRMNVPGSFELSLGAQKMAARSNIDAVICIGCVIQGETRHFDFICDAVANGITSVALKYDKPVVFGVLTTQNMQQAVDRSGGKYGNKGDEAGATAVKMLLSFKDLPIEENQPNENK
jgi:6,7-dimethyl-8-ribityllumazine synthase